MHKLRFELTANPPALRMPRMKRFFGSILVTTLGPGTKSFLAWTTPASQFAITFVVLALQRSSTKNNVYNILWALVFGFATLNILNLGTKHFAPGQNRVRLW